MEENLQRGENVTNKWKFFPNLEEPLKKTNFWSHISYSESDFGVFF